MKGLRIVLIGFAVALAASGSSVFADSWFEDYGPIPWEEERLRLDNFAHYLANDAELNGYIIFYVGSKKKSVKVEERINRARRYLILERKVDARRLFIINAGYRDETKTILHPIKKGAFSTKIRIAVISCS